MARDWRTWAFAAVPAVALVELVLHFSQVAGVVPADDWIAAKKIVESKVKDTDLVVFSPQWTDPVGRRYFGPKLATIAREARADEARFPRAIEVSIRGEHRPELADWREVDTTTAGKNHHHRQSSRIRSR